MTGIGIKTALRASFSFVVHFFHGGLLVTGILAAVFLATRLDWVQEGLRIGRDKVVAPVSAQQAIDVAQESSRGGQLGPELKPMVDYLARKYRVASEAVAPWVSAAYQAGRHIGLDPLLIVAVMAIESRFNPIAESPMGAQGLMQVMPRYHQDKLDKAGVDSFLDPVVNIQIGAQILKESIRRAGSVEDGLDQYGGIVANEDITYSERVLAEKQRLESVMRRARPGGVGVTKSASMAGAG